MCMQYWVIIKTDVQEWNTHAVKLKRNWLSINFFLGWNRLIIWLNSVCMYITLELYMYNIRQKWYQEVYLNMFITCRSTWMMIITLSYYILSKIYKISLISLFRQRQQSFLGNWGHVIYGRFISLISLWAFLVMNMALTDLVSHLHNARVACLLLKTSRAQSCYITIFPRWWMQK